MVMPPLWVHFYGVGVTALAATAAAVALTTAGVRAADARTVVVGGRFSVMAALLAVHGLVTPGVLVGPNGLIAVTGAATLPVGAAVLALSGLRVFDERSSIPSVLALTVRAPWRSSPCSVTGALVPRLVPACPAARSPALLLFAVGLLLFGSLAVRATTRSCSTRASPTSPWSRAACSSRRAHYGALVLTFMDLGWWLGHLFEVLGIALVGASVAYDLRRGAARGRSPATCAPPRSSRPRRRSSARVSAR